MLLHAFSIMHLIILAYQIHYLHVMHKEGVVSSRRYNPNFDSVLWIPVKKLIIHKNLKYRFTMTPDTIKYCRVYKLEEPKRLGKLSKWIRMFNLFLSGLQVNL